MNGVEVSTHVVLPLRFGGEHVFALLMEGKLDVRLYFACTCTVWDILSIKMEDNAQHVKGMFKKLSTML